MNYLAHAYFSYDHDEILVGNLISDFVKGKRKFDFSPGIQKGIALHRAIDHFTDEHTATRKAKDVFRPAYRLYSSAFVDIVYDHFLAADTVAFSDEGLREFASRVYATLDRYSAALPEAFQLMLPYMKKHNWLYHYRFLPGIEKSFAGLVRRSAYLHESDTAFVLFQEHYTTLRDCYQSFIIDAREFARSEFLKLNPG